MESRPLSQPGSRRPGAGADTDAADAIDTADAIDAADANAETAADPRQGRGADSVPVQPLPWRNVPSDVWAGRAPAPDYRSSDLAALADAWAEGRPTGQEAAEETGSEPVLEADLRHRAEAAGAMMPAGARTAPEAPVTPAASPAPPALPAPKTAASAPAASDAATTLIPAVRAGFDAPAGPAVPQASEAATTLIPAVRADLDVPKPPAVPIAPAGAEAATTLIPAVRTAPEVSVARIAPPTPALPAAQPPRPRTPQIPQAPQAALQTAAPEASPAALPEPPAPAKTFKTPPPPPVLTDEELEQEIIRLSRGKVIAVKEAGPVFARPYNVRLLDLDLMVPAMRRRDRWAMTAMSMGWTACFVSFWLWWLAPANRTGWSGLILNSAILLYVTAMPLYFLLAVSWLRKPDPAVPVPKLRTAFIVTKAPSEPWDTARHTLECMLAQDFPEPYDVWIADEAPTDEVRAWCAENGVHVSSRQGVEAYHRLTWPRRTKCKEGNLAYFYDMYGYEAYDVVVQLDCDHVPEPGYLAAMVRPFADPAVGYVAAPSVCDANAETSWSARGRLYREAVWHGAVQLGHNGGLAPVCIGSHYAVRTEALRDIGGIGPELAEDFSTTFLFNSAGWQGSFAIDAEAHGDGPVTFADMLTQEFQWSRSLTMVLFGLVPGHLRRMRGILRTRFAFALAYYPITAAVLTGGQLLGPVAVLTGVPWVHVSYPAFVLHMTAVSMWLLFGILLLRRRGLMRPAEAPVFTWENALFMLTRWPYVVRGVWAGVIGVIRPRPVTFKVTPKGTGGMPGLPTKLMAPFVVFSTILSGIAIYGELANRVIGYVFLCIVSALYYGAVSVVVPLLHMREVARSAGVRTRQAFRTARLPLTLGIATFLPLVYAAIRYYPHIVDLLSR